MFTWSDFQLLKGSSAWVRYGEDSNCAQRRDGFQEKLPKKGEGWSLVIMVKKQVTSLGFFIVIPLSIYKVTKNLTVIYLLRLLPFSSCWHHTLHHPLHPEPVTIPVQRYRDTVCILLLFSVAPLLQRGSGLSSFYDLQQKQWRVCHYPTIGYNVLPVRTQDGTMLPSTKTARLLPRFQYPQALKVYSGFCCAVKAFCYDDFLSADQQRSLLPKFFSQIRILKCMK